MRIHKIECDDEIDSDENVQCKKCKTWVETNLTIEQQPTGGKLAICEKCSDSLDNYWENKIMERRGK